MTSLRHITLYGLMNREKDLNRWKAEHFKTLLKILTASKIAFISSSLHQKWLMDHSLKMYMYVKMAFYQI